LGLALILLGLALATIARIQFEREHSKDAGLVTHGVYRRVRHPIYIFLSVAFAGLLLYLNQPLGLLGLLLMEIIVYRLARREERELEARYGQQYRQYRQQTWI